MKTTLFEFHSLNVRKVLGLGAMTLALAILPACSDDDIANGGGDEPEKPEYQTSNLKVTTDPANMPVAVYNYSFGKSSRTIPADFVMPDAPKKSEYENLPALNNNNPADAYIKSDITDGINPNGQSVYVGEGATWSITGAWNQGNATIYVLPGATLNVGNGLESGVTIYNYGTITSNTGENVCRLGGMTIYSETPLDKIANLNLACNFWTSGAIEVEKVHFNNAADVYVNCKIVASKEIIFDNNATFHVGYIESPHIEIMDKANVVLFDGGYIETGKLVVDNAQSNSIYAEVGADALINAGEIQINNGGEANLKGTFGNISILRTKWIYGEQHDSDYDNPGLNASVKYDGEVVVDVEESNDPCHPKITVGPDEPSKPEWETITSVVPDHKHPISATCIQFGNDNKAYVSWHEKGNGYHGCVEVIEVGAEETKLIAFAEDEERDYNHIMFDGNRLLAVGNSFKSAIIGEIALTDGTFTQGATLKHVNLKGNKVPDQDAPEFKAGDGNCIVRNGNYLSVASYGGLHTLNNDLERMTPTSGAVPLPGSAKHLSINGGKILALNLNNREDKVSCQATLSLYEASDYTWSNPQLIDDDIRISPVDGKNTVLLDNGAMYVCTGRNGLRKYTAPKNYVEIHEGTDGMIPANGVAVDDKYVYVAYGKGLYVYDKNNLASGKAVFKYTHSPFIKKNPNGTYPAPGEGPEGGVAHDQPSCNYVAVRGDYVYLAYGRYGYEVLRKIK